MELWLTRIKVVPNLNVDLGENEPSITEWQTPEGINLPDLSATPPTDSCYECDFHYLMLFLIRLLQGILNNERNWRQINLRNFLFIMQHFESSEVRYLTQVIALLRKTFFPSLISAGPKLNAFERLHRKHCIMDRDGNGLNETVMNPTNLSGE